MNEAADGQKEGGEKHGARDMRRLDKFCNTLAIFSTIFLNSREDCRFDKRANRKMLWPMIVPRRKHRFASDIISYENKWGERYCKTYL